MALDRYERGNTIRADVDFKSSDTLTDPSGSKAFVDVLKSDGTYLVNNSGATRDGTGEYHYFFDTTSTDPLGVYVIVWRGYHNLGGSYGYKPIIQRDAFQLVDVEEE